VCVLELLNEVQFGGVAERLEFRKDTPVVHAKDTQILPRQISVNMRVRRYQQLLRKILKFRSKILPTFG
jgi:hypothetical protein